MPNRYLHCLSEGSPYEAITSEDEKYKYTLAMCEALPSNQCGESQTQATYKDTSACQTPKDNSQPKVIGLAGTSHMSLRYARAKSGAWKFL